ncbi:toll/interleukin-1 receptor domain-containing protein [Porphyromonas sp. COT-052 OH4946]|uniref:toll/interleukin-1 receptor domain-containing protein n=1 Tax=Porphyromonas sp. COT-052 OH4946 TaxID=1515618 RepID=UPI00068B9C44|nr:toll/interleukin-1 receptor domain-containing protein [Porphyromonas sp. COT-052 OH4946]
MKLNENQIQEIKSVLIQKGLQINDIEINFDEDNVNFQHRIQSSYVFCVRRSIQRASLADVYCKPYTYLPHIYLECNSFTDILNAAKEWAVVTKYKLVGKSYYHKVFLSHASKDSSLIGEFVDKILRLSCGFDTSDIIYTSREDTGVEPGEGIPSFIKENLRTSSLILFLISDNYKKSEVCLNEMGAAWALEKETFSILLPGTTFQSLGWLTSLNKAIKIDDSEGLDTIYLKLSRKEDNTLDWNRQKDAFIKYCAEWHP